VPVYALGDRVPSIDPAAYVHPDAVVIGDVVIGPGATVWPGAVLRGDDNRITVGPRTSVQDNAVIHCTREHPTVIGADVTIGHLVHMEGCEIRDGALVGSGSKVLHRVVVGEGAIVGANAVVTNDTVVPPNAMALGVPAKIREDAVAPGANLDGAAAYVRRGERFRTGLRRLDP
jgi:carbonic anhydrase/acetyltransferase-like protein (isoleucine patch superfamily)